MTSAASTVVRDLPADARDAFVALGHRERHFFAHRVIRLPKGGVDGLKLAGRMVGDTEPHAVRQLLLHALPPVLDDFPSALFFDDDLVWHRQQFGLAGHVATASIVVRGDDLYVPTLVSDLVQRIGRRREHKTRVENRFKGWARLLVHAAIDYALDVGARRVLVPDSELALRNTDAARDVQSPLFEWVYDHSVRAPFRATHEGSWWVLDVAENATSVLRAAPGVVSLSPVPAIFLCHDIERGWGHLNDEPSFAVVADREASDHLAAMMDVERRAGVRATYSILGILLADIAPAVRAAGHAIAFHSFDHAEPNEDGWSSQLGRCREVDYRIKGYRPAQSRLGPELTAQNLAFYNFEWLASSHYSLGRRTPVLENGIVRIPILFDDFDLHRGTPYDTWEAEARATIDAAVERGDPAVFSLHDCYGSAWLPRYRDLLTEITALGTCGTLDELAAHVLLQGAE